MNTHKDENNELLQFIVNVKLEEETTVPVLLLSKKPYSICSCTSYDEYADDEILTGDAQYFTYLKSILYYLRDKEIKKNKIVINNFDWSTSTSKEILNIIYNFYKEYKLSDIIEIPINYRTIDRKLWTEIIDNFKELGVNINFVIKLDNASWLERAENLDWLLRYNTHFNFILSSNNINENFIKFENYINNNTSLKNSSNWSYNDTFFNWEPELANDCFKYLTSKCHNSVSELYDLLYKSKHYDCFKLDINKKLNCDIKNKFVIRVSDLTILPCENLQEEKFNIGKFIIKGARIQSVEAANVELANFIYTLDADTGLPTCDVCSLKTLCNKICFKDNYESSHDLFMPNTELCQTRKLKLETLFRIYKELGLMNYITTNNL